ncbi:MULTISPECIES: hypothetical protein [Methanobacterium]|uniref:Uncharacterized protein n=1 Tax=Methanobacterium veterum TaxID=408577 RepID=A0A9E5DPC4_9EURY|nr:MULTISPECIES: hypothetical protein [Methanobacterium]MCZ3372238.1 hypothetical protein [Methanobacterium veterum]
MDKEVFKESTHLMINKKKIFIPAFIGILAPIAIIISKFGINYFWGIPITIIVDLVILPIIIYGFLFTIYKIKLNQKK